MIRAKGEKYLTTFINNPQKHLQGTAMPRVGLKESTQDQVIAYMESVGDSKKDERERVGLYIIGFFIILSVFAYLWKKQIWREV
jgi:ubiquinol-cytochrome c reductase cytochrome c1 subunit